MITYSLRQLNYFTAAAEHKIASEDHDIRIGHGSSPTGKLTVENAKKFLDGGIKGLKALDEEFGFGAPERSTYVPLLEERTGGSD